MSKAKDEVEVVSYYKTLTFRDGDNKNLDTTLNQRALFGWRVVSTWTVSYPTQYEPAVYINVLLERRDKTTAEELRVQQVSYLNAASAPAQPVVESAANNSSHREKWDKVKQRFGTASASLDNRNDDDEDDIPRQWP